MHCQTHALKGWIERPTYGSPPLDTFPTPVPGKCSLLEDSNSSKPDRHQGQGEGKADGHRMPANLVVRSHDLTAAKPLYPACTGNCACDKIM